MLCVLPCAQEDKPVLQDKGVTMKQLLSITISLFLLLSGSAAFSAEKRVTIPIGDSPSMGPENAPVTIVEFIDFQ